LGAYGIPLRIADHSSRIIERGAAHLVRMFGIGDIDGTVWSHPYPTRKKTPQLSPGESVSEASRWLLTLYTAH
jgi:hypothetical protein